MSRLIDADELIEEIKSHRMVITGLRYGKCKLNEYIKCFIESILKIIDEQPTVNDWIPCSEKLPEDYDTVLAVTSKNHYSVYVYHKNMDSVQGTLMQKAMLSNGNILMNNKNQKGATHEDGNSISCRNGIYVFPDIHICQNSIMGR